MRQLWPIKRESEAEDLSLQTDKSNEKSTSWKKMKSIFAVFLVFSLLLATNFSYARKDLGDYWKNIMNGQPMPEAIKDLLVEDSQVSDAGKDHFTRDFDIRPNVILYHTHVESKKQNQKQKKQPFVKNFQLPEFQAITGRHS